MKSSTPVLCIEMFLVVCLLLTLQHVSVVVIHRVISVTTTDLGIEKKKRVWFDL